VDLNPWEFPWQVKFTAEKLKPQPLQNYFKALSLSVSVELYDGFLEIVKPVVKEELFNTLKGFRKETEPNGANETHDQTAKTEPSLVLYYDLHYPLSRAIYLLLSGNKVAFESKIIDVSNGEQNSEEFKRINPLGHVPVINHNGFYLNQGHAILQYLSDALSLPSHWYPKQPELRAVCQSWLDFRNCELYKDGITNYVFPQVHPHHQHKSSRVNKAKIEKGKDHLDAYIHVLDRHLAKNKFLLGNEISIADLSIANSLLDLELLGVKGHWEKDHVERYLKDFESYFDKQVFKTAFSKHKESVKHHRKNRDE